jgi:fructose-specific component phosphotransferase system IIB-like protein
VARTSLRKKAGENHALWERSNTAQRIKWQHVAQQGYDFYLNEQLSTSEKDALRDSGMPDFIINRITPIIEIMKYFVTANSPKWKAVGAEGSDADVAQVHSDIAEYCWYLSNGKSIYSNVILDSLTKGVGYFMVDIDQNADMGKGEVAFKRVEPFDVFVDPMSRDFLMRDATFVIIRKNLSKSQLKLLLPDYKSKIEKASGRSDQMSFSRTDFGDRDSVISEDVDSTYTPTGEDDEVLPFYECYKKIRVPFYSLLMLVPPSEEEMEQIKNDVQTQLGEFKAEMEVQIQEKSAELDEAVQRGEIIPERAELEKKKVLKDIQEAIAQQEMQLMSQMQEAASRTETNIVSEEEYKVLVKNEEVAKQILEENKFFQIRIELTCSIGEDTFLYEYVLPISEYPIIPFSYTYTGTPYPMSAVVPLIGKQQEVNKAHQIMIHNANLASNLRWIYQEGSIPEEEWEQYSSSAGALLKYRQGFEPPTPVQPAAINNAFYTITQEGKQDMEYISGIYSSMMGNTKEQPDTYRGLLANDEYGTRRIKAWMTNIVEPCLEHVGRVFKEIAQKTYTANKVFRIVQPEAGQAADAAQEKDVEINIPIYNDYGEAVGKWMDYESAKFDIRVVAGSSLPLNRWALLEEYFRWFQAGLIDDIAMLAETDVRNKKNIAKRKSLYSQLKGQLEQFEEAMKDKEGTIETLERQLVQAGIKDKIKTGEMEVRKDTLNTEAQQKLLRGMMQSEFASFKKDMRRELDKAKDNSKPKE